MGNDPLHLLLGLGRSLTRSQLEMLNVFMGFEQANRYAIYTTDVS